MLLFEVFMNIKASFFIVDSAFIVSDAINKVKDTKKGALQ